MDIDESVTPIRTNTNSTITIIFLIFTVIMILIIVFYFLFWKPKFPATSCQITTNCSVGQICQAGVCVEKLCSSDLDCDGNGLCINSFCTAFNCQSGNSCPTGTACTNGQCIRTGTACQSNNDCLELTCLNQMCVQCLSTTNCPIGQGCFGQSCRYPYIGETGANLINYPSSAQNNGNIAAPPGYFCSGNICGTGPTSQSPINCSGTGTLCPSTCPYCINSVCRCTVGQLTEQCRSGGDCISGLCVNNICVPVGGECTLNSNGTGCTGCCPISRPYCVNGTCSTVSLGAPCGTTGVPPDLCSNPNSLGVVGPTGISQNGMGFFCVNGTCQTDPGELNELCTPGSCGFIQNGALVCVPIVTPTIPEMRCLVV